MQNKIAVLGGLVLLSACATSGERSVTAGVYDPFEGVNRTIYDFNIRADEAVLEPVAKGYREVTTPAIRGGVNNFLSNLNQPIVFANNVLQLKPEAALETATRFTLNSTVGLAGIFDPAGHFDIPRHREDFGQTLGVWGVQPGPYLMVPFLGPSNLRDLTGGGVDAALNPINYADFDGQSAFTTGRTVVGAVAGRESAIEAAEILRDQPEPYVAWRRNYTQQREAAIRDGREQEDPFKDLPEFDDYDFGDE